MKTTTWPSWLRTASREEQKHLRNPKASRCAECKLWRPLVRLSDYADERTHCSDCAEALSERFWEQHYR
jgi:hypothetical protein